jgi:hypothetical protein
MSEPIRILDFEVDMEDFAEPMSPAVADFPELGKTQHITGGDRQLTNLEEIRIRFDYPLNSPVFFSFKNAGGFTLSKFWECVYLGYLVIYSDEDETALLTAEDLRPTWRHARPSTDGKYGIWGHDMDELFLEEIQEKAPGEFWIFIGS